MRFGVCADIDKAPLLKSVGYDYFESSFSKLGAMEESEFADFECEAVKLDFYPEAMNAMLPGTFRLTGETADLSPVKPFLQTAFKRARDVGTRVVVFGSGGARNLPEGFTDRGRAYDQLVEYLRMAGELAGSQEIEIAIEPLRFGESNIVNLYVEGVYLATRTGLPNVRCLVDYYHAAMNEEDMEGIAKLGDRLAHCHIARKQGRSFPLPGDGQDYSPFFNALKVAGYTARISIEGNPENGLEADAVKTLELLRSYALTSGGSV